MAQFLEPLEPIKTPRSALGFYRRRPDLRPALHPRPCLLEFDEDILDAMVKEWRKLDEGEDDPHYRGFMDTGKVMEQWRKARKVPVRTIRRRPRKGEYALQGNCAAWCEEMRDRLHSNLKIPLECMALVRCKIKDGREGHMVLRVGTTNGDAIFCCVAGVSSVGQPNLKDHRWHSMEYGGGWWKLKSVTTLEDLL